MRKVLLATALTWVAFASAANAANFTLSDINGVPDQVFGTATAVDLGANPVGKPASTDTVELTINIPAPPFLIDNGGHFLLSMSLLGTGFFDGSTLSTLNPTLSGFSVSAHDTSAPYQNGSFKYWTDGITANCGSGGSSGGCGHTFVVDIINFQGFGAATNTFEGFNVNAAVDIQFASGQTGIVGLTGGIPTQTSAVPGPIVGAGLPGLVAACGGLLALARRRRKLVA